MNDYSITPSFDPHSPTKVYIPVDLEDCVRELNRILPARLVVEIRSSSESELVKYHFGLGSWLRNSWGLWMEASRLRLYFVGLGITEADDMTGIIIECYWDSLNGKPLDVRRRIVHNKIFLNEIQKGPDPSN